MQKTILILVFVCMIIIAGCKESSEFEGKIEGEWKQLDAMPFALGEFSSAKDTEKVYFGGGFEPGGVTSNKFMSFNVSKTSFEKLEPLPIGLHHTSFAYLNGKVYLAGGWEDLDFDATGYFYAYDIENDEWIKKENMPYKRAAHRITAYNDSLFVFGGVGESTLDVLKYNTTKENWSVVGELPRKREHHTIEHFNDKIYLVSGRWDGQNIASIDVFDPQEGSFENIEIEMGVSGHASAVIDDKLHIVGGEHLREVVAYDLHQVVDFQTNNTHNSTPLPTNRHGHRAHAHNNSIFAFGGAIDAEYNTFETTTAMVHMWRKN